jgi:hypothetical protein
MLLEGKNAIIYGGGGAIGGAVPVARRSAEAEPAASSGVRALLPLVEAAGVEPASEAASPGTSTSVFGILISPMGSSRRDP